VRVREAIERAWTTYKAADGAFGVTESPCDHVSMPTFSPLPQALQLKTWKPPQHASGHQQQCL